MKKTLCIAIAAIMLMATSSLPNFKYASLFREAMAVRSVKVFDGIKHFYHPKSGFLWIKVSNVESYRSIVLDEPDRIVVDIDNMVGSQKMAREKIDAPFVDLLRHAQIDEQTAKDGNLNPNTYRFVLDISADIKFEIELEKNYLLMKIFEKGKSGLEFEKDDLKENVQNVKIKRLGKSEEKEKTIETIVKKDIVESKEQSENDSNKDLEYKDDSEEEKKEEENQKQDENQEEEKQEENKEKEENQNQDEKQEEENSEKDERQKDKSDIGKEEKLKEDSEKTLEINLIKPIKKELGNLKYVNEGDRKSLIIEGGLLTLGTREILKRYKSSYSEDGTKYTISFSSVLAQIDEGVLKIDDGTINSIEVVKNDDKINIVINATEKFNYHVISRNRVNNTAITILPKVVEEKRVVVIDPGHGGADPGAIYKGITEEKINLDISILLNQLLKKEGIQTYMLRQEDSYLSTYERASIANALDAKLFLSIHNNAALSNIARGSETLYFGPDPTKFNGKDFAKILQRNMISMLNTADRGIIRRPELVVLRQTKMPAALVEIAFMTNPDDMEKLKSDEFKLKSAKALKTSIIEALEILK